MCLGHAGGHRHAPICFDPASFPRPSRLPRARSGRGDSRRLRLQFDVLRIAYYGLREGPSKASGTDAVALRSATRTSATSNARHRLQPHYGDPERDRVQLGRFHGGYAEG